MKRLILLLFISANVLSQNTASRYRILNTPSYGWLTRIVPTKSFMDSTLQAMWNKKDDGIPLLATSASTLYTPLTRSLTINGTVFDLSANRTWTVGDLFSSSSYTNPTWLSSLNWNKITSTPTSIAGYGITDAIPYTGATASVNLGAQSFSVGGTSTLTGIVTTSTLSSGSSLYFNAAAANDVFIQTNGSSRLRVNTSYGAISVPYRVGSLTAPSATLDVTGTMSVSGTSTVTGLQNNGSSTITGSLTVPTVTSTGHLDLGCATSSVVSLKSGVSNIAQFSSSSGFLPNRTRIGSFTTPSATLDVTGTMSVSSTATVGGAFYAPSIASTSGLDVGCGGGSSITFYRGASALAGILSYGYFNQNLRVGATSTPNATLDVSGTMSVSNTSTLTGLQNNGNYSSTGNITTTGSGSLAIAYNYNQLGNLRLQTYQTSTLTTSTTSGTIAVLSDALFSVSLEEDVNSPADATTYYIGQGGAPPSSNSLNGIVYLPYNCTLVGWSYSGTVKTTVASAGSSTLSAVINGTNTVSLSTSITHTLASGYNNFQGSGLNTNITAGDYINCSLITPVWSTNPTNMYTGITLWFVRRP